MFSKNVYIALSLVPQCMYIAELIRKYGLYIINKTSDYLYILEYLENISKNMFNGAWSTGRVVDFSYMEKAFGII